MTLQDVANYIRSILDEPSQTILTDNDFLYYARQSLWKVYDLITQTGFPYYLTKTEISVSKGTNEYSLPSDFGKIDDVIFEDYHLVQANQYTTMEGTPEYYVVTENSILLFPIPDEDGTLTVYYHKKPTPPAQLSDTINIPELAERLFILDMLIQCATKGGYDTSPWLQQYLIEERNFKGQLMRDGSLIRVQKRGF